MFEGKTWWIVGASEGLGRALALHLDGLGAKLIVSARNAQRLETLTQDLSNATAVAMDVSSPKDVAAATAQLGEVDGMIYCVGQYDPMSALNWNADSAEAMADSNFMGALRVLGRLVPDMKRRNSGTIVLIGSLAGYSGLPGAIGYGASKAALMHLGENLEADFRKTNLRVRVVNPGFIKTRLTEKNTFDMPFLQSPEQAAEHVVKAIRGRRVSTAFPAPFSWLFRFGRYLPRRLFLRIVSPKT